MYFYPTIKILLNYPLKQNFFSFLMWFTGITTSREKKKEKKKRLVKMHVCVKRNYNTHTSFEKKKKKNISKTYSMLICPIFFIYTYASYFWHYHCGINRFKIHREEKKKKTHG